MPCSGNANSSHYCHRPKSLCRERCGCGQPPRGGAQRVRVGGTEEESESGDGGNGGSSGGGPRHGRHPRPPPGPVLAAPPASWGAPAGAHRGGRRQRRRHQRPQRQRRREHQRGEVSATLSRYWILLHATRCNSVDSILLDSYSILLG
eukprot:1179448-Prorocentrum_minimum.AAC.1